MGSEGGVGFRLSEGTMRLDDMRRGDYRVLDEYRLVQCWCRVGELRLGVESAGHHHGILVLDRYGEG